MLDNTTKNAIKTIKEGTQVEITDWDDFQYSFYCVHSHNHWELKNNEGDKYGAYANTLDELIDIICEDYHTGLIKDIVIDNSEGGTQN